MKYSLGREPRWNAVRRARPPQGARRIARCGGCGPTFAGVPLPSFFVARMERSEIRGGGAADRSFPDCAALHPGYETGVTDHRKPGTTPGFPSARAGFALNRTA